MGEHIIGIDYWLDWRGFVRKTEGGVLEEMQPTAAVFQLVNQQKAALAWPTVEKRTLANELNLFP